MSALQKEWLNLLTGLQFITITIIPLIFLLLSIIIILPLTVTNFTTFNGQILMIKG